jgi:DNA-binding LytR/AlgR family response regulator
LVYAHFRLPTGILQVPEHKPDNLPIETVLYIESLDNYIKIKTTDSSLISYESLSNMEKVLPSGMFLRIHRSYIVNIGNIEYYTSSYVVLGGKQFTIGRNYKEQVLAQLGGE